MDFVFRYLVEDLACIFKLKSFNFTKFLAFIIHICPPPPPPTSCIFLYFIFLEHLLENSWSFSFYSSCLSFSFIFSIFLLVCADLGEFLGSVTQFPHSLCSCIFSSLICSLNACLFMFL